MPRGGKRDGAGRKVSALTRKTRELAVDALNGGETPLEFLVSVMRNTNNDLNMRVDAAKAAAAYVHPRLAAVTHAGDKENPVALTVISGVPRALEALDVPNVVNGRDGHH